MMADEPKLGSNREQCEADACRHSGRQALHQIWSAGRRRSE